jgi:hypothetical protein
MFFHCQKKKDIQTKSISKNWSKDLKNNKNLKSMSQKIVYSVLRVKWSTPMSPDSFYPLYDKLFVDPEVSFILTAPKDAAMLTPISECRLQSHTIYDQGRWSISDIQKIQSYGQFLRNNIPHHKIASLASCTRHDYVKTVT